MLKFIEFDHPFKVYMDVSGFAIGRVLMGAFMVGVLLLDV